MSSVEAAILTHLASSPDATIENTLVWSESSNLEHKAVVGAIKSLQTDAYVTATDLTKSYYDLSSEAKDILSNGSQEIIVLKALCEAGDAGISMPDLQTKVGKNVCKIGMGNCMKNKWAKKDGGNLVATKALDDVADEVQAALKALSDTAGSESAVDAKTVQALKRRKLIALVTLKSYQVGRGDGYAPVRKKKAADLTKEMLDSGAWKTTEFKQYNFQTLGEKVGGGYLHPLLKVRLTVIDYSVIIHMSCYFDV